MKKKSAAGLSACKKQPASRKFPGILKFLFVVPFIFLLFISLKSSAQADLMVRDCLNDEINNGAEPSTGCSNPIYTSDGIKLTKHPYTAYTPYPFTTAIGDAWDLVPDEDAEYRDPATYSVPNWIYVKVTNPPTAADSSTGKEVLKIYWAKASTGLTWSPTNMWRDYFAIYPGCSNLYLGDEVTKPRPNWISLSPGDKAAVVGAFMQLDNTFYPDLVSWWDKQDQIHQSTHVHGGPTFLPWHRELVNRFENLLRVSVPNIKLPYWDWTTDPGTGGANIIGVNDIFHFGLANTSGSSVGFPFNTFDNNGVCNALTRGDNPFCGGVCLPPIDPALPPRTIGRDVFFFSLDADTTVVKSADPMPYDNQYTFFRDDGGGSNFVGVPPNPNGLEANHNSAHGIIGGNIGCAHAAFEDPFVFLLHSNVDKLFARWQRNLGNSPVNEHLFRLDNSSTTSGVYGLEAALPLQVCPDQFSGVTPELINPMEPWANNPGNVVICPMPIRPWMTPDNEDLVKTCFDASVVSPPIYDSALLTIPILAPGQSVIMQMPWYPPNPHEYSCFNDSNHFCLLARIVTPGAPDDGMSTPETGSVGTNAYMNNNIAWKNIQVYDIHPGSQLIACVIVRNMQKEKSVIRLQINNQEHGELSYFNHGNLILRLHDKLYTRWVQGGKQGGDFKDLKDGKVQLLSEKAWIGNILMDKEEQFEVCLEFKVLTVPATGGAFHVNLEQLDDKGFLGGEQFKLKYNDGGRNAKPVASGNNLNGAYTVSPNPMQSVFSITANNNSTENSIYIYDVIGQMVYTEKFNGKTSINVDHFQHGIYMLKIVDENSKQEFFQKIVKN